ncbi:hypothetical protein, partial [Tabrizicola sp.]|uniref:hypothetical protein n=1 Tax=Tabrizicola sp. TaxID=2005166 RepID=UPI003F3D61B5
MKNLRTMCCALAMVSSITINAASAEVGFETIDVPFPADRPINIMIWYPTEAEGRMSRVLDLEHIVAEGAEPGGVNLPLVVLSHGTGGYAPG